MLSKQVHVSCLSIGGSGLAENMTIYSNAEAPQMREADVVVRARAGIWSRFNTEGGSAEGRLA